ncbi:alcohol acetyltransferase [Choanephora cucurbitarum]|nr:alcohol acetyltransferase [Choanephora cucurbitarum]
MDIALTPDRPLGLLEKYQLSKSLVACYGNVSLTALIEHPVCQQDQSTFYHKAFAPALKRLINRHPFLSVRVCNKSTNQPYFARLSHIDLDKVIQVTDTTQSLQSTIQQQVSMEFNLDSSDPLWRIHIVPETEQTSRVTIAVHHIICDGTGLSLFLKELLSELREDSQEEISSIEVDSSLRCPPPYELSGAPELSLMSDVLPVVGKSLLPTFLSNWIDPIQQEGWKGDYPAVDGEPHCTEVRVIHVPSSIWKPVLEKAKKQGVTGHAILTAVQLLTWAELFPNQLSELATPVNARRFCHPPVKDDQMGNFVGTHTSIWKGQQLDQQNPWTVAKEYHQAMRANLSHAVKQPLYLKLLSNFPDAYIDYWQSKRRAHPMGRAGGMEISDLARYNIDTDGHSWKLKEVFFCQSAQTFTVAFTLNAISFNQQLFCTLSWQKGALEESKMNNYSKIFTGFLKKALSDDLN